MGKLEEKISKEINAAMKSKDETKLAALRAVKTAIQNEKTNGSYHELTDADVIKIIKKQIKQREESEEIYRNANREELANKEQDERLVLETYVPKMLSDQELKTIIEHLLVELNVTSMKDMGKIMSELNKRYIGCIDGKLASQIIKEKVS